MNKNGLKKIKRRELLELMLKQAERIKELEAENQKLNEELEYYRNRKVSTSET